MNVQQDIANYNNLLNQNNVEICNKLATIIHENLLNADSKIWHAHPVWFINGNPIVGYSLQKKGIKLLFWSGADFNEPALNSFGVKFKDAGIFYNHVDDIDENMLKICLQKAVTIQWDYKNIVKRKGVLVKLEL